MMDWAKDNDIIWRTNTIDGVVRWGGRIESYLTDVVSGIDPQMWQTELAILLAEGS